MFDRIANSSPRLKARVAGVFYIVTIVTSILGLLPAHGTPLGHIMNLAAGAAYVVVIALLYTLLKPVSRTQSLLAAFFGVVGVAQTQDSLFFFGFYCILVGSLIIRSTFFPRVLGLLIALAGAGLLINVLSVLAPAPLAHTMSTIGFAIDGIGEIPLALWLLVVGVNEPKWKEAAGAAR